MVAELSSIIGGYSLYQSFVWSKQYYGRLCQFIGILSMLQLLHEQHVYASLHYGQYRSLVIVSHDGVHLEVTESLPVSFRWTLVYAHPVRYYHSLSDRPMTVFQTVPAMFVEAAPVLVLVLSDDGIDGFMRNLVSHFCKTTGYLLWRPLPLFEQAYCHLSDKRLYGTVAWHMTFALLSLPLRLVLFVNTTRTGIASQFTGNCRITHSDSVRYLFFRTLPLQ